MPGEGPEPLLIRLRPLIAPLIALALLEEGGEACREDWGREGRSPAPRVSGQGAKHLITSRLGTDNCNKTLSWLFFPTPGWLQEASPSRVLAGFDAGGPEACFHPTFWGRDGVFLKLLTRWWGLSNGDSNHSSVVGLNLKRGQGRWFCAQFCATALEEIHPAKAQSLGCAIPVKNG